MNDTTDILRDLRAMMPAYPLTLHQAKIIAEAQANELLACSLTHAGLMFGHSEVAFDGLADVVPHCGLAVLGTRWASRTGRAGFRCPSWQGDRGADVPEPASDARGRKTTRGGGFLPRAAQILDEWTREAELGVGRDHDPRPAIGGFGSADLRTGPAQRLLKQTKGVLEIEPA